MLTPPTDSLYKFIAISGLVAIGFSVAYPWNKHIEYELKVAEVQAEIDKSQLKVDQLKDLFDSLREQESKLPTRDRDQLDMLKEKEKNVVSQMREAQLPVDERRRALRNLNEALRSYYLMGLVSLITGALLATTGFWLWYLRVQRFVDSKMRNDAENKPAAQDRH